jgi:hypothetical protein
MYFGIFAEGKNCKVSRDSRCQEQIRSAQEWSNLEAVFSMLLVR